MKENSKNRLIGFVCVLVCSFFTGSSPAVTQLAFKFGLSVETVLNTRFIIALLAIWIYICIKKSDIHIGKRNVLLLLLVGVSGFVASLTINESYQYLPAAIASILVFSYIIIVNIVDIAIGREKATVTRFMCLTLSLIGLVIVIWTPGEGISFSTKGVILVLLSAVFYAVNTLGLGAKAFHKVSAEVISGFTLIVPAVFNLGRCLASGEPLLPSEPNQWYCMLFLGLGASFIANVLYMTAIKKIGVSDTAITNTLEPVYSYIAGIVIMSAQISLKSIIGGIIILCAVAFLNYSNKGKETTFLQ